jgi:cytochrome b561
MQLRNSLARYGVVAQMFHWIIVGLIVTQYVLAEIAEDARLPAKIGVLANHKSVGMTILMLAVLRLAWRWSNPQPPMPEHMPPWQRLLAHLSHVALYGLLFAIPLSGWLMSSAKNYAVSWFKLFTFPDLIGPSESAFRFLNTTHEVLTNVLFAVAVLHILAALKHHFIDRDDVLRRMLPLRR